jgi:hypothetical protein
MDQHAQFRSTVRTVLTILLDETSDPADRVQHATDMLLGLSVPMPQGGARSQPRPGGEPESLARNPDKADNCGIFVPKINVLGDNERMIRAVLAAYRELGVTISASDTRAIISWTTPAQNLLPAGASITQALELGS